VSGIIFYLKGCKKKSSSLPKAEKRCSQILLIHQVRQTAAALSKQYLFFIVVC
jgi:hypothetical protein